MYEPVFESLQKAVAGTLQAQQELFKQWTAIWPAVLPSPPCCEKVVHFQKKWAEFKNDLVKKQCELLETQFKAGLNSLEESFRHAKASDPEELRAKTIQLWQKSFDCLRQVNEAQIRNFQLAVTRWTELMVNGAAGHAVPT
jgi:hypothetical protein